MPGDHHLHDAVYADCRSVVLENVVAAVSSNDDAVVRTDSILGMLDGLAIQTLTGSTHMTLERMQATCAALLDALDVATL